MMIQNNLLTRFVSCSVRSCVSRLSPIASSRLKQRLRGSNIANLTTEALLSSVRFVSNLIMAMLFYVPFGEFVHLHMH